MVAAIAALLGVALAWMPTVGADGPGLRPRSASELGERPAPMGPAVRESSPSTAAPADEQDRRPGLASAPPVRARGSGQERTASAAARGTRPITVIDSCLDGVGDCPTTSTTPTTQPPFHADPFDKRPQDEGGDAAGPPPCGGASEGGGAVTYQVTGTDAFSTRTGPGRHFPPAGKLSPGDPVEVVCWTDGAVVVGSSRWDRLSDGTRAPDAYHSTPEG